MLYAINEATRIFTAQSSVLFVVEGDAVPLALIAQEPHSIHVKGAIAGPALATRYDPIRLSRSDVYSTK